jgi:hypothetical protein
MVRPYAILLALAFAGGQAVARGPRGVARECQDQISGQQSRPIFALAMAASRAAPQIDSFPKQRGSIRLLVDASHFGGWEDMAAFEKHVGFVKTHHQNVERQSSRSRPAPGR